MSDHEVVAYPLSWPIGWERTPRSARVRANFSKQVVRSFATVRDELLNELRLLGVRRHTIVLSSNIPVRRDGLPYANMRIPEDVGIAVYFELNGEQKCFPSDKWDRVEDNMRAISLTINALRGLDRWGSKHMLDAVFAGFAALPAGGGDAPGAWWLELGVSPDATREEIKTAYFTLVRREHPDRGGDPERFHRIQRAYQQAKEARQS